MRYRSNVMAQLIASLALVWGYVLTDWFWVASASVGCLLWAVGFALWPSRKVQVGADEKPASNGLLSMTEFAEACDKRLRVEPDPEPAPPDAIPSGLRDPAFVDRARKMESAARSLTRITDFEREMRGHRMWHVSVDHMRSMRDQEKDARDALDAAKATVPTTDRAYTALTHCPEGHIGDHWIGDLTDEDTVTRTCAWAKCGATWQEKAWTTAA